MIGKRIGYIRVSTLEQNTSRQLEGIQIDIPYVDHASGKDANRPQLQAMLKNLRDGDHVIVHSMDRLSRNLIDLRCIVEEITDKGAAVQFMKENMQFCGNSEDSMNRLLLNMLGSFAEFERSLLRERQMEGIAIAKAKGVYTGRKLTLAPIQIADLKLKDSQGIPKSKIARFFGISRQTVYHYLKETNGASN
jgi:DNA invertase Pin-like site-specific DNA recombinase